MLEDPHGENGRLRCGDGHGHPVFAQAHKDVLDPRVDLVLVEAFFGHVAPVFRHRPLGRGRIEAEGFEAVMGRGAHESTQLRVAQRRRAQGRKCVGHGAGDARARVGQGPVKVEEHHPVPHVSIMTGPTPGGRLDSQGAKRAQRAQAPLYHPRLPARGASPRCRARDVLTATGP